MSGHEIKSMSMFQKTFYMAMLAEEKRQQKKMIDDMKRKSRK